MNVMTQLRSIQTSANAKKKERASTLGKWGLFLCSKSGQVFIFSLDGTGKGINLTFIFY
jgi:hypothetical protein